MKPEGLRRYLKARGCKFHKRKINGIEMWLHADLNFPITFYSHGALNDEELQRLSENLGLPASDLGDWRKEHDV